MNALRALLLFFLLAFASRADTCRCPPTNKVFAADCDAALQLTASQKTALANKHFLFGVPDFPIGATNEFLLHQRDYVTWYDGDLREPLLVAYKLTKNNALCLDLEARVEIGQVLVLRWHQPVQS
jgi:hypothetical protein